MGWGGRDSCGPRILDALALYDCKRSAGEGIVGACGQGTPGDRLRAARAVHVETSLAESAQVDAKLFLRVFSLAICLETISNGKRAMRVYAGKKK